MSKVFIEEETLIGIGNAIREKSGTTDLIATTDMASAISNLPSGGGGTVKYASVNAKSDNYSNTMTFDLSAYVKENNTVLIMNSYSGANHVYSVFIVNGVLDTARYQQSGSNLFGPVVYTGNITYQSYVNGILTVKYYNSSHRVAGINIIYTE